MQEEYKNYTGRIKKEYRNGLEWINEGYNKCYSRKDSERIQEG